MLFRETRERPFQFSRSCVVSIDRDLERRAFPVRFHLLFPLAFFFTFGYIDLFYKDLLQRSFKIAHRMGKRMHRTIGMKFWHAFSSVLRI